MLVSRQILEGLILHIFDVHVRGVRSIPIRVHFLHVLACQFVLAHILWTQLCPILMLNSRLNLFCNLRELRLEFRPKGLEIVI